MCKTHRTQTFVHQDFQGIHLGAFGGLSNPHISKIMNFLFSQNSPPSHLAMRWCTANLGYVQNPPNSKLSWYSFGDICRPFHPHISKTTNVNFSQRSPLSHLAMPWCTDQLGHVQNPPNSILSCTNTFMVFIWAHLEGFPALTSQKSRISFFDKTPHQAI